MGCVRPILGGMEGRGICFRILTVSGWIAMLAGAIDPLEGSIAILIGSGLVALGTLLGKCERGLVAYRAWVFVLIAIGVGDFWALSMAGGFGGTARLSNWWAMTLLPFVVGWWMGIWGPRNPKWVLWLSVGVGIWFLFILPAMLLKKAGDGDLHFDRTTLFEWLASPAGVLALIGLVTVCGTVWRLRVAGSR